MTEAVDNAKAALARIKDRLSVTRLGASTWREMDRDIIALRSADKALREPLDEVTRLTIQAATGEKDRQLAWAAMTKERRLRGEAVARADRAEMTIADALAWMDAGNRLEGHPLRRILSAYDKEGTGA